MAISTLSEELSEIKAMSIKSAGNSFTFSLSEFSGALADLGVMLPLILALISLNGMNATSVFAGVGIAYILTAIVYRLPIPVQPLKSVSALALALGLPPVVIITGAIWNAGAFFGMGFAHVDRWIHKAFPLPVVRGIQLGLAWLLFKSAWTLLSKTPETWQGALSIFDISLPWIWILIGGALVFLFVFLLLRQDFAALGLILFGIAISFAHLGFPSLKLAFTLPPLFPLIPTWDQLWQGFVLLALPQIPLSLGNSIYATADVARKYFGEKADRVTERNLMLTMAASDAMTAALGGVPVCHGSGGLTAHYRLGARTGGAPLMIGGIFLALGLLGSQASLQIIQVIPFPILGILLAYVGLQHMLLARDLRGVQDWVIALMVLVLSILTSNLAIGFVSAAVAFHIWNWLARG